MNRIYLDANIFIHMVEGGDDNEVPQLLRQVADLAWRPGNPLFATSELTLAEVMVKPYRLGDEMLVQFYDRAIIGNGWLDVGPVDRQILEAAAILRARWRSLRLPDAIHVATAVSFRCSRMLTGDAGISGPYDLTHKKGGFWKGSQTLRVVRPETDTLRAILGELSP